MEKLKGKIVIVTGASAGIGRAIAVALLKSGVHVAGLSRRLDKMNELKSEKTKAIGTFLPIRCDVTKMTDVKHAVDTIIKSLGAPYALINNAGVNTVSALRSLDVEKARVVFETNVLAVIALTKEVLPVMDPDGVIININSIAGHNSCTLLNCGAYNGAKRALQAVTDTLRFELSLGGSRVRVSSISPGLVWTEMAELVTDKGPGVELHMLEAEDIADCVKFILSLPSRVNVNDMIVEPRDCCTLEFLTYLKSKFSQ